jgi:replicative DNA helicase
MDVTPRKDLPPHSEPAERKLLAALLREPALAWKAVEHHGVCREAFFFFHHRTLFGVLEGMRKFRPKFPLADAHEAIVLAGLAGDFPDRLGVWLAELYDDDPTGAWVDHSCLLVRREHARRVAIHRANEVLRDAYDGVHGAEGYDLMDSQLPQVKREGDRRGSKPPRGRRR